MGARTDLRSIGREKTPSIVPLLAAVNILVRLVTQGKSCGVARHSAGVHVDPLAS